MRGINSLALDFLDKHPVDVARILEQLPVHTACSLIRSIQPLHAAGILECMVTSYGSDCLHLLETKIAASIIQEMKTPQAARLLRAMALQDSKNILDILPAYVRSNIHSALRYPDGTVGRVMDSNPFSVPESISIHDAIKRLKILRIRNLQEIFTVDDNHILKGVIQVTDLLSATRSASLQTIITSDVPYLSTRAGLNVAAVHPGWLTYNTLPVVGSGHILSGVLKSSTLMHVLAQTRGAADSPDALDELLSMTKMYWLVMAELVSSLAGDIKERGDQRD